MQPIENYRLWLSSLSEDLFIKLNVSQPNVLSSMFINILDGMTVYANMSKIMNRSNNHGVILKG
jgi:hypothetical protein